MRIIMICSILLCLTYQVGASNSMVYAEKKVLHSKVFNSPREFYVHLPESYQASKTKQYPVLYVLFGQSAMLGAIASIKAISNDIPELIVVGVRSKGRELMPVLLGDGKTNIQGQSFKSFLLGEIIPHVEQSYRVAGFSILSGHSGAGRFVLNSLLDDPSEFSAYFASSPSIDDNLINKRVKHEKMKLSDTKTRLFITIANEGKHMEVPFRELVELFSEPEQKGLFFHHKEYPEQNHSSNYIVSLLFSLRTLFDGWRPSWEVKTQGLTAVQNHYRELENRFGFEVEIPPLDWLQMSFVFSRYESEEGDKKLEEVVDYALNNYPNIVDRFFNIVEQLMDYGFKQPGKNLHKLLCKKLVEHRECK